VVSFSGGWRTATFDLVFPSDSMHRLAADLLKFYGNGSDFLLLGEAKVALYTSENDESLMEYAHMYVTKSSSVERASCLDERLILNFKRPRYET